MMTYRAILINLFKSRKSAKQPIDCKYLYIQVINRIAVNGEI